MRIVSRNKGRDIFSGEELRFQQSQSSGWVGVFIYLVLEIATTFFVPGTSSTKDLSYLGTQNYSMISKNLTIDRMALEAFSYYVHYRLLDHVLESLITYLEIQGI